MCTLLLVSACSDDESSPEDSNDTKRDAAKDTNEPDAGEPNSSDESADSGATSSVVDDADNGSDDSTDVASDASSDARTAAELLTCAEIHACFSACSSDACLDACALDQDYDLVIYAYYLYQCGQAFECDSQSCLETNCGDQLTACSGGDETDASTPTGACPEPTGDGTEHQGFIESDETWTAEDSPHRVTFNVNVRGAALTIEPCATVIIEDGYHITVGESSGAPASLTAKGEVSGDSVRPVRFQSASETEWWGGIAALATGELELERVIVSHAGHANGPGIGHASAITAYGDDNRTSVVTNVSLKNVRIEDSAGLGFAAMASGGFTADSAGVVVTGAGVSGGQSADVQTTYAAYVEAPAIHTIPQGAYTNNTVDEILLKAPFVLEVDETIPDRGVPYQMVASFNMRPPSAEPTTLTIEPGVTLKFGGENFPAASGMTFGDIEKPLRLVASGTQAAPITFTSGAPTQAPGDWSGLYWKAGAGNGNTMTYVTVEYGGGESATNGFGCGPGDNDALLLLMWEPMDAFITDSTFRHSAAGGIVRGWDGGNSVDLYSANTFDAISNGCNVSEPRDVDGNCPNNGEAPVCD